MNIPSQAEMNESYRIVAKHTFLAIRSQYADFDPIIILANDKEDARRIAKEIFVNMYPVIYSLDKTDNPQVYEIGKGE